jgi:hypothetical protein
VVGQSRELDFTPWGGAYHRRPSHATALVHRDARFLLKHAVVVDPDASDARREAARAWLSRSWALVHRWGSAGAYQNFPGPARPGTRPLRGQPAAPAARQGLLRPPATASPSRSRSRVEGLLALRDAASHGDSWALSEL